MSAAVTLKVVEGPLHGAEFVYRLPTLCSVGRSHDCTLRLPSDAWHQTVSRRHCLLEIDPPHVRVCDLGSLNGTLVNGASIGQRNPRSHLEELCPPAVPDYPLGDGDELRVGENVFRIGVSLGEAEEDEAHSELCGAAGYSSVRARKIVTPARSASDGIPSLALRACVALSCTRHTMSAWTRRPVPVARSARPALSSWKRV